MSSLRNRKSVRVLVAEDNLLNQHLFVALLDLVGVSPAVVSDGAQLLRMWRSQDWDLILTDIEMPEMNGIAATSAIRAEERSCGRQHTAILAVTAHAERVEAGERLFDAVLSKPVEIKPFLQAVGELLGRETTLADEDCTEGAAGDLQQMTIGLH